MRVTKLDNDAGYWTANLTVQGLTVQVDRRYGSWRLTPDQEGPYRELHPEFCRELQRRVRPKERAAAREGKIAA